MHLQAMKRHVRVYLEAAGLREGDYVECESCGAEAVDVHHIENRGMGGSKTKDTPENLMALCRTCHDMAHRYPAKMKPMLKRQHEITVSSWRLRGK